MSKILFINANPTRLPYRVAPLGLAFVASFAKSLGARIEFFDTPFSRDDFQKLKTLCQNFQPDLIALSVRNLDNSDFHNFETYLDHPAKIIREIRSLFTDEFSPAIIAGGPAPTVDAQKVLLAIKADSLVLGEGEAAIPLILDILSRKAPFPPILDDHGEPFRVKDLSLLPCPSLHEFCDMKQYTRGDCGYPVQTKRGCPLQCIYCTYAQIEGRRYRLIPVKNVVDEIEAAYQKGILDFEFVDSTFNLPPGHAKEILAEIKRRNLKVNFVGTGINPARLDDELISLMKETGFKTCLITAESGSDTTLQAYRKGFTRKHLEECAKKINKSGLQALWVFLLAGPAETEKSVEETLDFIHHYIPHPHLSYITSGIRIYKNAPIERLMEEKHHLGSIFKQENISFYHSAEIAPQWLEKRLEEFRKSHPNLMLSKEGHSLLIDFSQKILQFFQVSKPWWRFIPTLNKIRSVLKIS